MKVPAFVTDEWIQGTSFGLPRAVRQAHGLRAEITALCGFPWPKESPRARDSAALVRRALAWPGFGLAFHTAVSRLKRGTGKPSRPVLFGQIANALIADQRAEVIAESFAASIRDRIDVGDVEEAQRWVFVCASWIGAGLRNLGEFSRDPIWNLVLEFRDLLGEAGDYYCAAARHFSSRSLSFDRGPYPLVRIETPPWLSAVSLRDALDPNPALLDALHTQRERIRAETGFDGWPDERPAPEDFPALVADGAHWVGFLASASGIAREVGYGGLFGPLAETLVELTGASYGELSTGAGCVGKSGLLFLTLMAGMMPSALGTRRHVLEAAPASVEEVLPGFITYCDAIVAATEGFEPTAVEVKLLGDGAASASDAPAVLEVAPLDRFGDEDGMERFEDSDGAADRAAAGCAWCEALGLAGEAVRRDGGEPDGVVADLLRRAADGAAEALRAHLAARPASVDVGPLVARLADAIDALAQYDDEHAGIASVAGRISICPCKAPLEQANAAAIAAAEAEAAVARVAEIDAEIDREVAGMPALKKQRVIDGARPRIEEAIYGGVTAAARAVDAIEEGNARLGGNLVAALGPDLSEEVLTKVASGEAGTAERFVPLSKPNEMSSLFSVIADIAGNIAFEEAGNNAGDGNDFEVVSDLGAEEDEATSLDGELAENLEDAQRSEMPSLPEPAVEVDDGEAATQLLREVRERVIELVEREQFGLAWALTLAFGNDAGDATAGWTASELRLAALCGLAEEEPDDVAIDVAQDLARTGGDDHGEMNVARRIMLYASCIEGALFRLNNRCAQIVDILTLNGVGNAFFALTASVRENQEQSGALTPAGIMATRRVSADEDAAREWRDQVEEKILFFEKSLQFRFTLGQKVKMWMISPAGPVGRLKSALTKGGDAALEAAREFAAANETDADVRRTIHLGEASIQSFGEIDGPARVRMADNVSDLARRCAEFVAASEQVHQMRARQGRRVQLEQVRISAVKAVDRAVAHLGSVAVPGPAAQGAVTFALRVLQRMRATLEGERPAFRHNHAAALYGPLLFVPHLRFGRGWLPTPWDRATLVSRILDARFPVPEWGDEDAIEAAVVARLKEDSFVAARLIIAIGWGLSPEARARLHRKVEDEVPTRRGSLVDRLEQTRKRLDKVARLAIGGSDEADRLAGRLGAIEVEAIPAEAMVDSRSEDFAEGIAIFDFGSADALISEIRERLDQMVDRQRAEVRADIDRLAADPTDLDRLRAMIDDGSEESLLAAVDVIHLLKDGPSTRLPERKEWGLAFERFWPAVPEFLSGGSVDALTLLDACAAGTDVGPLTFSSISSDRRAEATERFQHWLDFRTDMLGRPTAPNAAVKVERLLTDLGFETEPASLDKKRSRVDRKEWVFDMRLSLRHDSEALVLPDFGSLTQGAWRVGVFPAAPTSAEIDLLTDGAGTRGVLLICLDHASRGRREQIAMQSLRTQAKILVLDQAILLAALTEPEFRTHALFELAQPFSFAKPYDDYGNSPVPREMFVGRRMELRSVRAPDGSNIVYGGRRLGKTALLLQVRWFEHRPSEGRICAYVMVNFMEPPDVWPKISESVREVFPQPVADGAAFAARVREWLAEDMRRSFLLLLDECNSFIEGDSPDFRHFGVLHELMEGTGKRFKVVLSGQHNVARAIVTPNSPLLQIDSAPIRVGPFLAREMADAEALATRALASLGYRFEAREDVWKILAFVNYYPVLMQVFCRNLLATLQAQSLSQGRIGGPISSSVVASAIDDSGVRDAIKETFLKTIKSLDKRYELITLIVAVHVIVESGAGDPDPALSEREIVRRAAKAWEKAFGGATAFATIDYLLDEMEGFGVLRKVGDNRWTLRSRTLLSLLGSDYQIMEDLEKFKELDVPAAFEPALMRHEYRSEKGGRRFSPLSSGQEREIMLAPEGVAIVFGSEISSVDDVSDALLLLAQGQGENVAPPSGKAGATLKGICAKIGAIAAAGGRVAVIDRRCAWAPEWVQEVMAIPHVEDGHIRVVFVGGPDEAERWFRRVEVDGVPIVPLQPWSTAMLAMRAEADHQDHVEFVAACEHGLGAYSDPMHQVVGKVQGTSGGSLTGRISKISADLRAEPVKTLGQLGVKGDILKVLRCVRAVQSGQESPVDEALFDYVASEELGLDGTFSYVAYAQAMGLLSSVPGAEDQWRFNPLAFDLLAAVADGR